MCGRFATFSTLEEIADRFPIDRVDGPVTASYNIAPTQPVLALARTENARVLGRYHWGLVPRWARDTAMGARMINARAETVAEKPAFRDAFLKRRCLIIADGFFEWHGKAGEKQPFFVSRPDSAPFAFAGLWETWQERSPGAAPYRSCAIITRPAEGPVKEIHHRMPVILGSGAVEAWLDPAPISGDRLTATLHDGAVSDLVCRPVSRRVNSPKNDSPENIIPLIAH